MRRTRDLSQAEFESALKRHGIIFDGLGVRGGGLTGTLVVGFHLARPSCNRRSLLASILQRAEYDQQVAERRRRERAEHLRLVGLTLGIGAPCDLSHTVLGA